MITIRKIWTEDFETKKGEKGTRLSCQIDTNGKKMFCFWNVRKNGHNI